MAKQNDKPVMTKERTELIEGLRANGGKIVANGKGHISPAVCKERLQLSCKSPTALLNRAEKEGLIRRDINGRRTKGIYLLHGRRGPQPAALRNGNGSEGPKPVSRKAMALPLPPVSSNVTVAMVQVDRDGRFQLGLRNDEGSWVATIDSYAAAPVGVGG